MRTIPLAVTALASALLLTSCNGSGGGSSDSKNGSACSFDGVAVQVGPASTAPAAGDSGEVPVSLTNQSKPCTLDGFPTVSVKKGDGGEVAVPTLKGAKAQKLKLAKGDAAAFTIAYVRGKESGDQSFAATTVVVTLPGNKASKSYKWSYGPIQGKSDVDASVSAFTQSGD